MEKAISPVPPLPRIIPPKPRPSISLTNLTNVADQPPNLHSAYSDPSPSHPIVRVFPVESRFKKYLARAKEFQKEFPWVSRILLFLALAPLIAIMLPIIGLVVGVIPVIGSAFGV